MDPVRNRSRRVPLSWPASASGPRILVEAAEPLTAWAYEQLLEGAGFDVLMCRGPYTRDCPLLRGEPCPAADDAAAIVFALDLTDPVHQNALAEHRRAHPGVPVCVDTPKGRAANAERAGAAETVPPTAEPRTILRTIRRMLGRRAREKPHMRGRPAAAGRASGRVRIVRRPIAPDVDPGDVLVASELSPAVVSTLPAVGALILEAPSDATSRILGRELGLPVVDAVHDACTRLRDGDLVTVDGNTGRILLEPTSHGPPADAPPRFHT